MTMDATLFDRMARDLYVAVISDMLDGLGLRDQVMRSHVRPIDQSRAPVLVGRAATVVVAPQFEVVGQPYTNQIAAIDALSPTTWWSLPRAAMTRSPCGVSFSRMRRPAAHGGGY
ncbi:MAG: hypothetical protein R2853_17780 [Thermomicrobiales bacterium]